MMYCFDSSALVKRYAPEQGSAWVKSLGTSGAENTLYLAQIGMVEIAVELAVDLTRRYPLRGYDAVHLATAVTLNKALLGANLAPLTFVAADDQLCAAARGEGLTTENPNEH